MVRALPTWWYPLPKRYCIESCRDCSPQGGGIKEDGNCMMPSLPYPMTSSRVRGETLPRTCKKHFLISLDTVAPVEYSFLPFLLAYSHLVLFICNMSIHAFHALCNSIYANQLVGLWVVCGTQTFLSLDMVLCWLDCAPSKQPFYRAQRCHGRRTSRKERKTLSATRTP